MPTLKDLGFDPETGTMLGNIGDGMFPQPQEPTFDQRYGFPSPTPVTGNPQDEAQFKLNMAGANQGQWPQAAPGGAAGAPFNSRVTYYAPGVGGRMEGPWATSRVNPLTGERKPFTLDDVRLGRSPWVTVASDPSRYGQNVQLGALTYRSPLDGKTYTVPNVQGYVHDTGGAFRGRPDKLDVATGDFRGFSERAASPYVNVSDGGRRMVTAGGGSPTGGWETSVGAEAAPGGVGYTAPGRTAQGATTNPAELVRPDEGPAFNWRNFIAGLKFNPAKQAKPAEPFAFDRPLMRMSPIGRKRAQSA